MIKENEIHWAELPPRVRSWLVRKFDLRTEKKMRAARKAVLQLVNTQCHLGIEK
jgi:hypothetical protein